MTGDTLRDRACETSANPAVSHLTDHLGYWLRMVSNHVSHAFAARVADRGITVAEWVMLRALYGRAPLSPSHLATEMGMTRGAISKLADRLEAKGLATRTASVEDRRAHTLTLTAEGARLVPELAALADANDAAFFGVLAPAERAELERLLRQLAERGRMSAPPLD